MTRHLFHFILLIAALADPAVALGRTVVPIYYPSTLSAKERQDSIKAQLKSDVDVVVFAKFKDFIGQVRSADAKVIVAPASFRKYYPQYKPVLQFHGSNGKQFKYLLVTLGGKWTRANLCDGKIGLVEEVDRAHLKDLVSDLCKTRFKMIRSVSKPEDLFPLLMFKSADFILLSPDDHLALKDKFTAKVQTVLETGPVDYPMVYAKDGAAAEGVLNELRKLTPDALERLGFKGLEPVGEDG